MRLPAVVAALVLSILTGIVGIALAATPSNVNRQGATPAVEICPSVSATAGTSWVLDVTGAQLSGVGAGHAPTCYSVPAGAEIASHEHSGWFLLRVQSGTISFTVEEGIMWAHCTPDCGTNRPPGSAGEETLLPGATVTLMPGDWVLQDRATTHAFRNQDPGENAVYQTAFGVSPLNGDGGCWGAC